ncbi:MAG: rRNA synthase [Patescibacteria group bacterium]|jgi:23S rRNA pseudouridine1911/1915/1917 synthase|nr:rRNA synthase [Patescibacteria group bacterium]
MNGIGLVPDIIEQTDDYVVIVKPAGLLVHPADSSPDEPTLVDWLVEKFPQIKTVGDEPELRPGIVHRLDREASGLMVIALNQKTFDALKMQFQDRTIEKEYLVLVHGKMLREFGEINLPIGRMSRGGRMAAHSSNYEEGNEARTEYFVEKRFSTTTLLRVHIHTGRTHQIRVHMFSLQHPVVGDTLYPLKKFGKTKMGKAFPLPPRLCLHAARLVFTDKTGARKEFLAELPPDFANYLTQFKAV